MKIKQYERKIREIKNLVQRLESYKKCFDKDLRYENGHVITDQAKEAESDHSSGIRNCKDKKLADELIRNTYKTLLSRGQKGCFIYCEDKELGEFIKRNMKVNHEL